MPTHPHTELLALLLAARPTNHPNTPCLSEIVPTADGHFTLRTLHVDPDRWSWHGPLTVMDDLRAGIEADPWPHTHLVGYHLMSTGGTDAWTADRTGTVQGVQYRPEGVLVLDQPQTGDLPNALRAMALAVNGPAVAADRRPAAPIDVAALGPAPCLYIGEPGQLLHAISRLADEVHADLILRSPRNLDAATWRSAQLILLTTDRPALDAAMRMPARPGVVLLNDGDAAAGLSDAARVLGVEACALYPNDHRWLRQRLDAATRTARGAMIPARTVR